MTEVHAGSAQVAARPAGVAESPIPRASGVAALIGALVLVLLWTLAWYWTTAAEIAGIWWRSDTYAHGLAVLPISAWLVWRARARLAPLQLRPVGWMALPVIVCGVLWLLGTFASVAAARHFALVSMLVCGFAGVLGWQATRALLFPLLFLVFAIPVGDFLLPTMMDYTAKFTVWALRLSGVPVYQEGLHFVVPNGRWSVVEACSGIRYLIASLMVGALYAYLNYRSLSRRLLFMVVALLVPIVANWLRAYMIVMLGYHSGNTIAVGVDHLLYGWVFFGIVIFLMFWIGSRWQEAPAAYPAPASSAHDGKAGRAWLGALPVLVAIAAFPLLLRVLDAPRADFAVELAAPVAAAGWSPADEAAYRPQYSGQRAEVSAAYRSFDDAAAVNLYVAWFADQHEGSEMVTWGNGLVPSGAKTSRVLTEGHYAGERGTVLESVLETQHGRLLVWHWYRINGGVVTSDVRAKLLLALDRLYGRPDASAVIVLHTADSGGHGAARARLQAFVRDHGAAVDAAIDTADELVP